MQQPWSNKPPYTHRVSMTHQNNVPMCMLSTKVTKHNYTVGSTEHYNIHGQMASTLLRWTAWGVCIGRREVGTLEWMLATDLLESLEAPRTRGHLMVLATCERQNMTSKSYSSVRTVETKISIASHCFLHTALGAGQWSLAKEEPIKQHTRGSITDQSTTLIQAHP